MKDDRAMGIQYLEAEKGKEVWYEKPPFPPIKTQKRLIDSSPFRILLRRTNIKYLDALGNPTNGPTNRMQTELTLKPSVPPNEERVQHIQCENLAFFEDSETKII